MNLGPGWALREVNMPWCENDSCGKTGLRRDEIEFDEEEQLILCRPCYEERVGCQAVVLPAPAYVSLGVTYGFHFTSEEGLKVDVQYRGVTAGLRATKEELSRLFGFQ